MARQRTDYWHVGRRVAPVLAFVALITYAAADAFYRREGSLFHARPLAVMGSLFGLFFLAWWPLPYWCPGCRRRLTLVEARRPDHVYHCHACDTDWATGGTDNTGD